MRKKNVCSIPVISAVLTASVLGVSPVLASGFLDGVLQDLGREGRNAVRGATQNGGQWLRQKQQQRYSAPPNNYLQPQNQSYGRSGNGGVYMARPSYQQQRPYQQPQTYQRQPVNSQPATAYSAVSLCDAQASDPDDKQKVPNVSGVKDELLNPDLAIQFCQDAIRQFPNEARFHYQAGRAYWKKLDYTNGIRSFTTAAQMGHAASNFYLGEAYLGGKGVAADPAKGEEFIKKASEGGFAPATAVLADADKPIASQSAQKQVQTSQKKGISKPIPKKVHAPVRKTVSQAQVHQTPLSSSGLYIKFEKFPGLKADLYGKGNGSDNREPSEQDMKDGFNNVFVRKFHMDSVALKEKNLDAGSMLALAYLGGVTIPHKVYIDIFKKYECFKDSKQLIGYVCEFAMDAEGQLDKYNDMPPSDEKVMGRFYTMSGYWFFHPNNASFDLMLKTMENNN